jgi:hypothetical protein
MAANRSLHAAVCSHASVIANRKRKNEDEMPVGAMK